MDSMTLLIISLAMCLVVDTLFFYLLSSLPKPILLANCGPSQGTESGPRVWSQVDWMQIICLLCYFEQITEKSLNNINITINNIAIISTSQDCCEDWMK